MTLRRTETPHRHAQGLQALPPRIILARLLEGQQEAAAAVAAALPAIEAAAQLAAEALGAGRRLGYAGAGSSGLMALADALELAGTFGFHADRTPVLVAGGAEALLAMTGAVEDDAGAALHDLDAAGLSAGDALICVSASGTTPYTLAAARAARDRGMVVIGLANAEGAPLLSLCDRPVLLDTGPEVVAGSTRMGAATAQKIALNMISTLAGLLLGHVHDGEMVNVIADNAKLRDRARRIVAQVSGVPPEAAADALMAAEGAVKPAVLIAAGVSDPAAALRLLADHHGHLGPALAALRGAQ
jgi:N-acetylmuramic acid 6-phosphate etherase